MCEMVESIKNQLNGSIKEMNLTDIALLKLCVLAVGIMVGISLPRKYKKAFLIGASVLYLVTFIPFMIRFLKSMGKNV